MMYGIYIIIHVDTHSETHIYIHASGDGQTEREMGERGEIKGRTIVLPPFRLSSADSLEVELECGKPPPPPDNDL